MTAAPLEALAGRTPPDQRIALAALLAREINRPAVLVGGSAYEFYTCGVDPQPRLELATNRGRAATALRTWGFETRGASLVHAARGLRVDLVGDALRPVRYFHGGWEVHVSDLVETVVALLGQARHDRASLRRAELVWRVHRERMDIGTLMEAADARALRPWAATILRAEQDATSAAGATPPPR